MDITAAPILATLLTSIVGFYLAFSIRRKNDADAASALIDAADKVLSMYKGRVEELKADVACLKHYIEYLRTQIDLLYTALPKKFREQITPIKSYEEFVETK